MIKKIIALLRKADEKQLERIYYFLCGYLG